MKKEISDRSRTKKGEYRSGRAGRFAGGGFFQSVPEGFPRGLLEGVNFVLGSTGELIMGAITSGSRLAVRRTGGSFGGSPGW